MYRVMPAARRRRHALAAPEHPAVAPNASAAR